jgi:hypothetical protein
MCNDYRLMVDVASIVEGFADLKIKIRFSEGSPNIQLARTSRSPTWDRSSARSKACRAKLTLCSAAGVDPARTARGFRGAGDLRERLAYKPPKQAHRSKIAWLFEPTPPLLKTA